jgi:hypothetical protein
MVIRKQQNRKVENRPATAGHGNMIFRASLMACLGLLLALPASRVLQSQNPGQPIPSPEASRFPDANDQMSMHEQQNKKANVAAANLERKKQIADDSAKLVKLATDLKAEVDKTSKDTLSVGVIRKAEEIEKLAHNVKEKMKLTMGGN